MAEDAAEPGNRKGPQNIESRSADQRRPAFYIWLPPARKLLTVSRSFWSATESYIGIPPRR